MNFGVISNSLMDSAFNYIQNLTKSYQLTYLVHLQATMFSHLV